MSRVREMFGVISGSGLSNSFELDAINAEHAYFCTVECWLSRLSNYVLKSILLFSELTT